MKELRARLVEQRDEVARIADQSAERVAAFMERVGAEPGDPPLYLSSAAMMGRMLAGRSHAEQRRQRAISLNKKIQALDDTPCICGHRCADHDDYDGPCTLVDDCKGCPAFVMYDGTSRDRSDDIRIAIFRLNTERARAHPKALPDVLAHVLRVVGPDETVTVDDIRTETAEGVRYLRLRDDITVGAKLSHTEAPSGLRGVV